MTQEEVVSRLAQKGVKPTANRILIYRELAQSERPMSLSDIEMRQLSLDKSSIFRVLTLFMEHHVVHSFSDGRGVLHYELCGSRGTCNHTDSHLHFYCESCQQSFCLEDIPLPSIELPEGYTIHSASFVLKGECPACRSKHQFA